MHRIFLLVASALAFAVPVRADEPIEMVFSNRSVASTMSEHFHIALGDRYSPSFIKERFRPYTVEFSDECEIECFVISRDGALLNIYGSEETGKITMLTSWSTRVVDSLGVRVGMPLRKALKADQALCEYAETLMCRSPVAGMTYFVDSGEDCHWDVSWDKGEVSVTVPACARVGGFQISAF